MKPLKYITFDDGMQIVIVMFSPSLEHRNMAIAMGVVDDVLGAGFVDMTHKQCFGKSTSLNISSTETDTIVLRRNLPEDLE